MYTNKDVSARFGISRESVRLWSNLFRDYLSPSATPEAGRQRNYTDSDLEVFALVDQMRRAGASNDDIAAALAAGQRGQVPGAALAPRTDNSAATLKRQVNQLAVELEAAQSELLMTQGENRLLKQQLADKERQLRDLYRELARLEAGQGGK